MLGFLCGSKKYHQGRMIYLLSINFWARFCMNKQILIWQWHLQEKVILFSTMKITIVVTDFQTLSVCKIFLNVEILSFLGKTSTSLSIMSSSTKINGRGHSPFFMSFTLCFIVSFLFDCMTNCSLWVFTKSFLQLTDFGAFNLVKVCDIHLHFLWHFFAFHCFFGSPFSK